MNDFVSSPELKVVGKRLPRVDAGERVTGRAIYPADFKLPGMVLGGMKRSPHAHARIVAIDTAKARAMRGVLAVITAADFPELAPGTTVPYADATLDMTIIAEINMARRRVLWAGQPVAAVAAVDQAALAAALDAIKVEYEVLKPVTSIAAALAPGAPVLYEAPAKGGEAARPPANVGSVTVIARGDIAKGFAEAAGTGEIAVTVDTAHQGYIEPHAVVASAMPDGLVTVWASTQGSFQTEFQTATILGLPQSKVKVVPLEIGGGFGGKIYTHIEPAAARLSQLCGRPVKIVMSRAEVMVGTGPACAAQVRVKVGAGKDGRITAIDGHYIFDTGGLPGTSTTTLMQASAAPYQTPHIRLEGLDVVTNKPRSEAYRGPGGLQAAFAMEQAVDALTQKLGICPLELRRRNAAVTGSTMPIGTPFPAIGLTTILDRVAAHHCWTTPLAKGRHPRGRGLAVGYWRGTSMTSAGHVTLTADGRVMVTMGTVDIAGTRTSMAQVAAEEFGIGIDDVHVQHGDTKSVGYSDISAGSRVTRTMAAAVVEACQDALGQLKRRAAEKLQCAPADVTYADGVFGSAKPGGASMTLKALMQATTNDGAVVGRGSSTRLPYGVEFAAHVADVEVDPATGQVTVLRYTAFQDVGRAVNPPSVEGQIEGSVVQGLGWALTEGFDYDADGRLRNGTLLDYRLPTALDVPAIEVVLIETPVPGVPYGLRGVGEVPIVPPPAVIANAISRAVGVRLTELPMTPERVLRAIRGGRLGAA